jgi:glycosyltransferase involved in cell wall biosynthesis
MKTVGIYRTHYPSVSETFITEQISHLRLYQPTILHHGQLCGDTSFTSVSVSEGDQRGLQNKFHTLIRSSNRLRRLNELKSLDLVHAHMGPDGIYAMSLAQRLQRPLIVTFHGFETTAYRLAMCLSGHLANVLFVLYEQELKQTVTSCIAVSNFIQERLIARGYPKDKIIRHYIGVDTDHFQPSNRRATDRYILCVGRHTRRKGIDTLLGAFSRIAHRYPEVRLVQIGSGPLTEQLKALSTKLGIAGRVHFLGNQPHEQVRHWMQEAEIFSLPSRTSGSGDCEALGIVFNEASSCAVPVVATLHGGIPEVVLDGDTGLLVPEGDEIALADKLALLLSDRALACQMGTRGREFMLDTFDIRKQTTKLEAIYDQFT